MRVARWSVLAALLAACSLLPAPATTPDPVDPSRSERIDAIRSARLLVAPRALELTTAARDVVGTLGEFRAALPTGVAARRRGVTGLAERSVPPLREVVETRGSDDFLAELPDTDDVVAARAAWRDAAAAADRLVDAVEADLAVIDAHARIDGALRALRATWREPGSRNQQIERLGGTADAAAALAERARAIAEPGCTTGSRRRAAAAERIAAGSRELRDLVAAADGEAFDAAVERLLAQPLVVRLVRRDVAEAACWLVDAPTVQRLDEVLAAVGALEAALDPPALRTAPDAGTAATGAG